MSKKLKAAAKSGVSDYPVVFNKAVKLMVSGDKSMPNVEKLAADAVLMLLAGTDTIANALAIGKWNILQNDRMHQTLVEELREVFPRGILEKSSEYFKRLPYLVFVSISPSFVS